MYYVVVEDEEQGQTSKSIILIMKRRILSVSFISCVIQPSDAFTSASVPLPHRSRELIHSRQHRMLKAGAGSEDDDSVLSAVSTFTFPILLLLLAWFGTPQFPPLDFYMHVHADDTSPQMLSTRSNHISTNIARETYIEKLNPRQEISADANTRSVVKPRRKPFTLESLYLNREGRLMDLSSILDETYTRAILEEINTVERETGTELQFVIVDRISYNVLANGSGSGDLISERQYAKDLFSSWHIAHADKKNGALILVLLQQQRVEIAVSRDLNPYMTSQYVSSFAIPSYWCSDIPKKGAAPMFQSDCYGEGIYNAVVGVANRIRAIDGGVASKGRASVDDIPDALALMSLVGLASFIAWSIGCGIIHERMYPMGEGYECSQCGGKKWNRVGTARVQEPTYDTDGLEKIICKCSSCGFEDFTTRKVSRFQSPEE